MSPADNHQAVVVADLGGSNIRFASLCVQPGLDNPVELANIQSYQCARFDSLAAAISEYLAWLRSLPAQPGLQQPDLCLAVPGPVHVQPVQLTNLSWTVDPVQLAGQFGGTVHVLNDLSAQAMALPWLADQDLDWWRMPAAAMPDNADLAIVAVGTGLGAAGLIDQSRTVESEAGHSAFTALNSTHLAWLLQLWPQWSRVSWERLLSGPGLLTLFRAMHPEASSAMQDAADISAGARQGDRRCQETVAEFSRLLGSFCGDLGLSLGAVGGVFLSGGVLAHLDGLLDRQAFLAQFDDKGRFTDYCHAIPIARVRHDYPGLLGAARYYLINQQRS